MKDILDYRHMVLFILWAIATSLNLTKAFHIDDPFHVLVAQWIAEEPWRPMSGTVNWSGVVEPFHRGNHPPLFFYGMSAWGVVFGFGEIAMHAFLSLFTGLAIYFMYKISTIFSRTVALWTTGFFALSPGFLVNQNVMLDVPLVALILGALYHGCEAVRKQRIVSAIWSAFFISAAIGVKYTAVAVFPALVLVVWFMEKRPWWILGIPLLFLLLWSAWNLWEFGYVHFLARSAVPSAGDGWILRFESWVMTLGSICPWVLVFAVYTTSLDRAWCIVLTTLLLASFVGTIALAYTGVVAQESSDQVLLSFFVAGGALAVVPVLRMVMSTWGNTTAVLRMRSIILVNLLCLGGFILMFAPWMATRHLMLIVPLLLLLSGSTLERMPVGLRWSTLMVNALLGVSLSLSDKAVAAFYAEQAVEVSQMKPGNMWYSGSMGWGWYAARSGMRDVAASPEEVDVQALIAMPVHGPIAPPPGHLKMLEIKLIEQQLTFIDGFSTRHWMRFYSANYPQLPWRISWVDKERISVQQVVSSVSFTDS